MLKSKFQQWLPDLDDRIWILSGGRLLSQIGIGFTLFYAPIFFVDRVGLTATQVGLGIGLGSLSGLVGRFLGGAMADSPNWGRRPTLLSSALVSAVADGVLLLTHNFPMFVLGNLLMGFGVGLYWPATETVVADLTADHQRNEAYAVVRLADSLGLGTGVVLGGLLIALTDAYRALFMVDGISFLVFFALIYRAIPETRGSGSHDRSFFDGWGQALQDSALMVYALVNVVFTSFLAQIQSTLPVYLHRFVGGGSESGTRLSIHGLGLLFAGHVALLALCQLPVARGLSGLPQARALMVSASLWGLGFGLIWLIGVIGFYPWLWAAITLAVLALATAAYTPVASALVVNLAPDAWRGVYLSVNSMCWAIGYLIGPPLGGWALDQGAQIAHQFWLVLAASSLLILLGLGYLDQVLQARSSGPKSSSRP